MQPVIGPCITFIHAPPVFFKKAPPIFEIEMKYNYNHRKSFFSLKKTENHDVKNKLAKLKQIVTNK